MQVRLIEEATEKDTDMVEILPISFKPSPLANGTHNAATKRLEINNRATHPLYPTSEYKTVKLTSRFKFKENTAMVVEDDSYIRQLLVELLNEIGCQVITAIDGQDAIEKLGANPPSFIISDVMMPRCNGYQLFQYIQQQPQLKDIPFIFLTARSEISEKLEALERGVEDYWLKPFNTDELAIRLQRLLQKINSNGDIKGRLAEMPLPDLLQSLASGNKSGTLCLSHLGRSGKIYLQQGHIIDAEFEDMQGRRTIYCLINWCGENGTFSFRSQKMARTITIKQSTPIILMESMRRREEEQQLINQLPDGDTFLLVNVEQNPDFFSHNFADETMRILQLFDGTHCLRECLRCIRGDLETLQIIVALNKAGLLYAVTANLEA
jgi:CheY-like chemotaxis protein